MKIYTRTGDQGETSLFAGGRVRKDHLRVEAYGTLDELNSVLGVVLSANPSTLPSQAAAWLSAVQNDLFVLGSDMATPMDSAPAWLTRLDEAPVKALEDAIDRMDAELPSLQSFILPGGTPSAAMIHVARTVCRRAERLCVALGSLEPINPTALIYLNRLSDFLFTLARWVNFRADQPETPWKGRQGEA